MNRRPGLSLVEVMIAIFVLGLGLLGVLSLFPLGAVRMAQAIKDDRCQNHNLNTAATMHRVWREETVYSDPATGTPRYRQMYPIIATYNQSRTPSSDYGDLIDPFTCAMENPNYPPNPDMLAPPAMDPNANANDPDSVIPAAYQSPLYPASGVSRGTMKKSFCVYVDPLGWNNGTNKSTAMQYWIAGRVDCIPRRSLRRLEWVKNANPPPGTGLYTVPIPAALKTVLQNRYFVLLEDIGFARDGTPGDSTGSFSAANPPAGGMNGQVQRDGRYSCGIMFRRPQSFVHRLLEMTVVVYSGRATVGASDENAFTTRFVQGSTEATVYWDPNTQAKPKIRKNTWLLDGTMVWQPGPNGTFNASGPIVPDNDKTHGIFYRVIDVVEDTEILNGQQFSVMRVQLQEPAEANSFYNDANATPYGIGVVMDNVVEVFPAKSLSPITRPVP